MISLTARAALEDGLLEYGDRVIFPLSEGSTDQSVMHIAYPIKDYPLEAKSFCGIEGYLYCACELFHFSEVCGECLLLRALKKTT